MLRFATIIIIALITLCLNKLTAQEVKAEININVEQLEFETRNNVSTMKRDLESYIDNTKFLDMDWEGDPINVNITIYLSGGANNRYSAKLFLASTRTLDGPGDRKSVNVKFYDDKWSFEYGLGANLTYNPLRFDEFTSLIDYYMLLVIGFDLDTYGELDGSPAFAAARKIVEMGANRMADGYSTNDSPGEFTRFNLVSELTNMRYDEFRRLVFSYYVDGLDLMAFDKTKAINNIKDFIYNLALFKKNTLVGSSNLLQLFFDSKAQEIATIFNGSDDEDVFKNLKYLDPSNTTLYEEAEEGKLEN